ncbi:MAG: S1-like domain-containing RNA-binding protein [Deltaproteobacteria bacterium]
MPIEDALGRRIRLAIRRIVDPGAIVGDSTGDIEVLLPTREIPAGARPRDELEVFLYLDSDDRPIATARLPLLVRDEVAFLTITAVTDIGAFADWGLGKELLIPFAEQARDLVVGERQPIGLYLDKSARLAGTMFVTDMLAARPRRAALNEWIEGVAWRNDPDIGLFAILERSFVGLVPASEPHRLTRGEAAKFRVAHVQPDGKLVLSLREQAYKARVSDGEAILAVLSRPRPPRIGDRSDPETLRELFGLSKKAFKRAVGGLLKAGQVRIDADGFVTLAK